MDPHKFHGKDIPHIKLDPKMNIEDLVDVFANSGFNGRQLGEAAKLYAKMIEEDATICLTISGAMTPVGFGGIIKTLIERGFVDWIVTTGANVYHEDHFALGLPVKQGSFDVDDMKLYENEIVRIRDVYIKFEETLEAEDQTIQKMFADDFQDKSFTTAEFCNLLGKRSKKIAKHPEKSFITTAYEYDVPVYISTMKDSSLALNLAVHRLEDKKYDLDFVREIIEQAAIVYDSKKSGILELGGGVPKNTAQQTGPLLDQILRRNDDIEVLAANQLRMLMGLWATLKSGGRLLYVTCSVLSEENEEVVQIFLDQHDDAKENRLLPNNNIRALMRKRQVGYQILPGTEDVDGFYYACLEKLCSKTNERHA